MRHSLTFLMVLSFLSNFAVAQQFCPSPATLGTFHPNLIRTVISPGGDLFTSTYDAVHAVPFSGPHSPGTFFNTNLWLAGIVDGEFHASGQAFRFENNYNYVAGPMFEKGELPVYKNCLDWDKVWTVTRKTILRHIEDASDGTVDFPEDAVFGWPGNLNPYFEEYNGFTLPADREEFAPFQDLNGNGIYEPNLGEYPALQQSISSQMPEQLSWCVFNDISDLSVRRNKPFLAVEIQLTAYGFYCPDDSLMNRTLFTHYKVLNRSGRDIDSVKVGFFFDPDLGCFLDDYIGSWPEGNAMFAYNADSLDGNSLGACPSANGEIATYKYEPPVQSLVSLSRPMTSAMYFLNPLAQVPVAMYGAETSEEYYHVLTGRWRDGTPLTFGNDGFDPEGTQVTSFVYSGNPLDTGSWSQYQLEDPTWERRPLLGIEIGDLPQDSSFSVDMAFITHFEQGNSHLQNIPLMYAEIPVAKEAFDGGFQSVCQIRDDCAADCVWTGDANADRVVDERDVIEIALHNGDEGPVRTAPLSWNPYSADNWLDTGLNGQDLKHVDCNGSGAIEPGDIELVRLYFGNTHSGASIEHTYRQGEHLQLDIAPFPGGDEPVFRPGELRLIRVKLDGLEYDSIYGISFRVEYPEQYFSFLTPVLTGDVFALDSVGIHGYQFDTGVIATYMVRSDHRNAEITPDYFLDMFARTRADFQLMSDRDTQDIRIANIHAVLSDGTQLDLGSTDLEVVFTESTVSVEDYTTNAIRVFPNPSSGHITIQNMEYAAPYNYEIMDLQGRILQKGILDSENSALSTNLGNGIFLIRLFLQENMEVHKIVIQEK